jgi:putative nucleotidyltransferase with HDIG domain
MAGYRMEPVAVEGLRVGVYVSLDPAPFAPEGSDTGFVLRTDSQVQALQGMGRRELRWCPVRSEVPPATDGADLPQGQGAERQRADDAMPALGDEARSEPPFVPTGDVLADQRESLERCERQFGAVSRSFRNVLVNVRAQPVQARDLARSEVTQLVGSMAGEDVTIRLLSEKSGQETALHAINVSVLSVMLGRTLGLDEESLRELGLGALLHDLGKIELPDRVRMRDDNASASERRMFQSHVAEGDALAERMALGEAARAVLAQHHEHADGSGFPRGLRGDAIHRFAAIVGLVNHYDNLCNPGNPIHALTPHDAMVAVYRTHKDKFDPAILQAFVRMMGVYPPGSLLQLSDSRFAMAVAVDPKNPAKPRVIWHDPKVPVDDALVVDLTARPEIGIQRAIKPSQLPREVSDYLKPRKRQSFFFENRAPRAT